jgi:hypothetical protein
MAGLLLTFHSTANQFEYYYYPRIEWLVQRKTILVLENFPGSVCMIS